MIVSRLLFQLGGSDYVFSNSFLEDLERLWELRSIIPDPCNPNTVVDEKNRGDRVGYLSVQVQNEPTSDTSNICGSGPEPLLACHCASVCTLLL